MPIKLSKYPVICVTSGDPAGIGPDLALKFAATQNLKATLVVIGNYTALKKRAAMLNLKLKFTQYQKTAPILQQSGTITVLDQDLPFTCQAGVPNPKHASYVLSALNRAINGCQTGEFDALVTGPVNKAVINQAGIAFTGHTEYLATITNTKHVTMMLSSPELKVSLVTTHLPLNQVAAAITKEKIHHVVCDTVFHLQKYYNLPNPKIKIAGLNPHAGENGHIGNEEISIISPIITKLQQQGLNIQGPMPADTMFTPVNRQKTDAFIAMYHDQGLPVLKALSFGNSTNITLGLPLIRTSVDHGTAYELAGTNNISLGSFNTSINEAITMTNCHHLTKLDQYA